jgi:UDPglucose--hexose-1-phosphate uridylyltransferase
MNLSDHPHRRYNPLTDSWVLVSPQRTQRPWRGQTEEPRESLSVEYDQTCFLCPGNTRANGEINPKYEDTFIFTNDFQSLLENTPLESDEMNPIFKSETVQGTCRVLCFSPRHDLTLAHMKNEQIETVINAWKTQAEELGKKYQWVQIFENKGSLMGCSNPHPHGQIWASNFLPNEISVEDTHQNNYYKIHKTPLLLIYAHDEIEKKERVVYENDDWLIVLPFWAVWPFETMLLPKFAIRSLTELSSQNKSSLASAISNLLRGYDELFGTSMPYSMGWHFAPADNLYNEHWQLHAHYYPPLLRSASIKKFMVGYEMLAEPQRDLTPEIAAERLRSCIATK